MSVYGSGAAPADNHAALFEAQEGAPPSIHNPLGVPWHQIPNLPVSDMW